MKTGQILRRKILKDKGEIYEAFHVGAVVGQEVFHMKVNDGKCWLEFESLNDFLSGEEFYVYTTYEIQNEEETRSKAEEMKKEFDIQDYSKITNNCEYPVYKLFTGISRSPQVQTALILLGLLGYVFSH